MMPEQATLLEEAHDNVRAARLLADQGFHGIAASRAYYAMFYVAQAFLLGDGRAFSKHSAVIAAFGRYFANVGRVPKDFHRILIDAEKLRITSDYDHGKIVTTEQVQEQIAHAEEFLEVAERVIGPLLLAGKGTK